MPVHLEKINYQGLPECYRLSNGVVDAIITTGLGPRIIRFGFVGEVNEFAENSEEWARIIEDKWHNYGGHRLWHAPESFPRTYFPDNAQVTFETHADFARVVQPMEATTGIQKEMDLCVSPDNPQLRVTHRLRNLGLWPVELAPWAVSTMAPEGTAIAPLPARGSHPGALQPTGALALWPYTDMSDIRWTWGCKYVLLRQDRTQTWPQKCGIHVKDGWVAYARAGHLFVKTFSHLPGARYPDFGSSVEVFTNSAFLELESLGPLTRLEPGVHVEHTETWFMFRDTPTPRNDIDVDTWIRPKIESLDPLGTRAAG